MAMKKEFLKARKECPWIVHKGSPKPHFECRATDDQCSPAKCAPWHFRKDKKE